MVISVSMSVIRPREYPRYENRDQQFHRTTLKVMGIRAPVRLLLPQHRRQSSNQFPAAYLIHLPPDSGVFATILSSYNLMRVYASVIFN